MLPIKYIGGYIAIFIRIEFIWLQKQILNKDRVNFVFLLSSYALTCSHNTNVIYRVCFLRRNCSYRAIKWENDTPSIL